MWSKESKSVCFLLDSEALDHLCIIYMLRNDDTYRQQYECVHNYRLHVLFSHIVDATVYFDLMAKFLNFQCISAVLTGTDIRSVLVL